MTVNNMASYQDNKHFIRFLATILTTSVLYVVCLLNIGTFVVLDIPTADAQDTYGSDEKFAKVWDSRDEFDQIYAKMMAASADTCSIMHTGDLKLPEDTVSHKPDIKEININPVFPNRTSLLHLHNMALNRAFFFSYILQSR